MTDQLDTPAIEIRGLTAQFGGLTAIASLDLTIRRGKITSIIGPNGAGKTTLFNCVSGVLRPTSGTIVIAGRDIRRPWPARTTWACLAIAFLATALSGAMALNVNGLWRAAVRRPNHFSAEPFHRRAIVEGLKGYWRGELAVERGSLGRWNVVTADGAILLATVETHDRARRLRNNYERLRLAQPSALEIVQSGNKWLLLRSDGDRAPIDGRGAPAFASRQAASDRRDLLISVAGAARSLRRRTYAATLAGALLGAFGFFSVWRRTRWTPEVVAAAGVARTFQNLRLFPRLSVLGNVLVACEASGSRSPAAEARQFLERVSLSASADCPAGQLAYGDRRRLEIARALGQRPWLLLLDEPAAGMNPTEKVQLKETIRRICDRGITIVLIEHEMSLVMGISDHVIVLADGRKIAEGTPDAVRRHPAVIEAYLGTAEVS